MFRKVFHAVGAVASVVPVVGPVVKKVAEETGRAADNVAGGAANVVGGALGAVGEVGAKTVKEAKRATSKVIGEVSGGRRKAHRQADQQRETLREQTLAFLNNRKEAEVGVLRGRLAAGLAQYAEERNKIDQEIIEITEMQRTYEQWRNAIIEIENNQPPAALESILNGDEENLKNFLLEGEFGGNYNPLTLATEKFFTSILNAQNMKNFAYKAVERLSDDSELFYLEPDAKNETFAGLLLDKYANQKEANEKWTAEQETTRKEMAEKLLKQCVKDAEVAIHSEKRSDLQKLVTLGKPLLDMLTPNGQTLSERLRGAGYEDLLPRTAPRP